MTKSQAFGILAACNISRPADFHTLNTDQVEALLAEADQAKYRKPRNANGSRARYFYAYVERVAGRPS